MKILVFCHEYPPYGSGIANIAYHTIKSWRKSGHQVDVCSPSDTKYKIDYAQKFIEKFGGLGIIYYWIKASKIIKKLNNKYDLIYLHNPLIFKKIKSNNIRCIVHTFYYFVFNEYAYKNFFSWPYYFLMMLAEKFAYYYLKNFNFILTSPKSISELNHYNINGKIGLVMNGHEFNNHKKVKLKVKLGKRNLVYVGRLDSQKNLFSLLDTFKEVNGLDGSFTLSIIGDGVLKKKLINYAKNKKIKKVFFLGYVEHEKMLKMYNNFDFFISSSYYEGFPATLSESLGEGLVPLLSPIKIYKFILNKINSGKIIDFNNPKFAARKIVDYGNDINLKNESKKIISISKKLFNWDRIANDYLNLEEKWSTEQ